MQMFGYLGLTPYGDIRSIVNIDEKRSRSFAELAYYAPDAFGVGAPSFPVVCLSVSAVLDSGFKNLGEGRIIVIDYQNGTNRSDESLFDKFPVMLIRHRTPPL